jgi:diguanylate cyclase (GGDEF)-like protein
MSRKKKIEDNNESSQKQVLEQTLQYEKKIYDLEQLLDIAKSFCQNLDFSNLLESIVYICMAQMHVLGAEIFVRDPISNDVFNLETSKSDNKEKKLSIPVNSPVATKLLTMNKPVTIAYLKEFIGDDQDLRTLESLSPTLIVPLVEKTNHLSGILILQERIAIEEETTYTEYEQNMIMSIASLATVAINNASLMEMSSTDMMTHLRLKYFFFNQLTEAIDKAFEQEENIAVLMFDIDFFKKFNDTYGHECGDFVLITVANIIKSSLRESDIASRYGGEEFTVLLRKGNKDEAMKVAERIRQKIEDYDFVYNDQHLHVTVSGGVSIFDKNTNPVELPNLFVNQADSGLYMSKNNGRNQVTFFDPAVHKLKDDNE